MTPELISAALVIITGAGGGLSLTVGTLWKWVNKRVQDCEADRRVLHAHINSMNAELQKLSHTVGHMEGALQEIKSRNYKIDHTKGAIDQ